MTKQIEIIFSAILSIFCVFKMKQNGYFVQKIRAICCDMQDYSFTYMFIDTVIPRSSI